MTSNKLAFETSVSYPTYYTSSSGSTTINDGNWHHVVMVRDTTQSKVLLYVDGNQDLSIADGTAGQSITNSEIFEIGTWGPEAYDTGSYTGKIDETRIYNRALSPREVRDLYAFAPGPKAYYSFDEGSGTTLRDISGNGYDSTSFTGSPTWTTGKFGKALYFNGTSDAVSLPVGVLANKPKQITYEIWLKGKDQPTNTSIFAAQPGQKVNVHAPWGDSNMYWDYGEGCCNGRIYKAMPSNYMNNNWTHFAFTADMDTNFMQIYANGVLWHSGTITANAMVNAPTSFVLGAYTISSYFYKGWLDEFKIYDYVRTSKQIVEDMNAGHPAGGSPVGSQVGYWKFDEGYGTNTGNSGNASSVINGTLTTNASAIPTWTNQGKFNKALSFNGTSAYVTLGTNDALNITDAITVSSWVKLQDVGAWYNLIYSRGDSNFRVGVLGTGWGGLPLIRIGTTDYLGGSAFPWNIWAHLVFTFDDASNTVKIYINGKLDYQNTSATATIPSSSGTATNIGFSVGSGYYAKGDVDEVKIYNAALTSDEIALDYNRGASMVSGLCLILRGSVEAQSLHLPQLHHTVYQVAQTHALPGGRMEF